MPRTNEAIAAFAQAQELNPGLAETNLQTGKLLANQGRLDSAQAAFNIAAWLRPGDADARENLGLVLAQQGKLDEAMAQFQDALRLQPDARIWHHLAGIQAMKGQVKEAIASFQHAIELKPDFAPALNNLAWLLATTPNAEFRNGPEAVKLAERACQATDFKEILFLGTLAAAYAEAGRFADAIRTGEQARQMAIAEGKKDLADKNQQLVELYRAGKPYHQ
jgi:protein O-mannosyl-transferase